MPEKNKRRRKKKIGLGHCLGHSPFLGPKGNEFNIKKTKSKIKCDSDLSYKRQWTIRIR